MFFDKIKVANTKIAMNFGISFLISVNNAMTNIGSTAKNKYPIRNDNMDNSRVNSMQSIPITV